MKNLFIPAKRKIPFNKNKILSLSNKLPKKIIIAYSIQYKEYAEKIKSILNKKHDVLDFIQILGCSNPKINKEAQAILLISEGRFHSISLAYETKIPTYLFNTKLEKITEREINKIKKNKKVAYVKFLHSDNLGILISTKKGQQKMDRAIKLKKKIKNKKTYLFISNNINKNEFDNFNIDSWINTACPRIDFDSRIMNINDVLQLLNTN